MNNNEKIDLDKIQLWTQNEMLSAIVAGIAIGTAISLAFLK